MAVGPLMLREARMVDMAVMAGMAFTPWRSAAEDMTPLAGPGNH